MERFAYQQATCAFALVCPQDLRLHRSNIPRLPQAMLRQAGPWVLAVAALTPLGCRVAPGQPVLVTGSEERLTWRLGRAAVVEGVPLVAGRLLLLSGGDRTDLARELQASGFSPELADRAMPQTALGLRPDGRAVLVTSPGLRLADVPAVLERLGCLHGMSLGFGTEVLVMRQPNVGAAAEVLAGEAGRPVEALLLAEGLELVPPDASPSRNLPVASVPQPEASLAWRGVVTLRHGAQAYRGPSTAAPLSYQPGGAYFPVFRADPLLQWYQAVLYDGSHGWFQAADLQLTPAPGERPCRAQDVIMVIDPGHGGAEGGALGPAGLVEKDVNLDWGLQVRDLLAPLYKQIWMTRTADVTRSLAYRSALATASGGNLLISLHNNAGPRGAGGTETYYQVGGQHPPEVRADSRRLAGLLHTALLAAVAVHRRANPLACTPIDRGATARLLAPSDQRDYHHILRESGLPSCLVEGLFVTHPAEEACLRSSSMRQALAQAVAQGTQRFLQGYAAAPCNFRGPHYGL